MIKNKNVISFFLLGFSYFGFRNVNKGKDYKISSSIINIEILDRWMTLRDYGVSLDRYLQNVNCKKVAIYGLGMLGNHLYEELVHTDIELIGIDQSEIYDNYQMPIYKPNDCFEDIDMIIITTVLKYQTIYQNLSKNYQGKILSLVQLLSECESYLIDTIENTGGNHD